MGPWSGARAQRVRTVTAAAARVVADRAEARLRAGATAVVAVAGPVAVGKSTLADAIALDLRDRGRRAAVVSTDGFLLPVAELAARGIAGRKGFPESYDVVGLRALLEQVRDPERAAAPVTVPVYSHETYDVVAGVVRTVPAGDVLVLEGVNALSATRGLVDLGVYVDAPIAAVETWYASRFVALTRTAGPGSFYARFAGLPERELEALARDVYRTVNLPNLVEHIAPSRDVADLVVCMRDDHELGEVLDGG